MHNNKNNALVIIVLLSKLNVYLKKCTDPIS